MPRSVTRAAFVHALCAKLDLSTEGVEKKLLQERISKFLKTIFQDDHSDSSQPPFDMKTIVAF